MAVARVVIDCRWLSIGGAGRLTELLLRGMCETMPDGRWVLWGPPEVERWRWAGAQVVTTSTDPRSLNGQRSWFEVPRSDLVVFLHQQRPLRPVPSVTAVLDTVPVRFHRGRLDGRLKRLFLRRVASLSKEVVTISAFSRACIVRDLGVPPERVSVVSLPYDERLVARVNDLRTTTAPTDIALYVGAFSPHKNLDRLARAFPRTAFAASGGRLLLVGGSPAAARALLECLEPAERDVVDVRPRCDDDELHRLFAGALFLVQPSLEEGFGLPVWEALTCGLPVCASDGGALPEITAGRADTFDPTSVDAITRALDACASRARSMRDGGGFRPPDRAELGAPSVTGFARQLEEIVRRNT